MKEVLQPLNEKAADIIVRHADLLQSAQMEPLLLQLVAHVCAYRVILKRSVLSRPNIRSLAVICIFLKASFRD